MRKFILCLESKKPNTEKNYFKHLNKNKYIKENYFNCNQVIFSSIDLEKGVSTINQIRQKVFNWVLDLENDFIYITLDNDKAEKTNLLLEKKKEIMEFLVNLLDIKEKHIILMLPPSGFSFEMFILAHTEKTKIKQAKKIVPNIYKDHKSTDSDYPLKLFKNILNIEEFCENIEKWFSESYYKLLIKKCENKCCNKNDSNN